jgi:hypothetical protein
MIGVMTCPMRIRSGFETLAFDLRGAWKLSFQFARAPLAASSAVALSCALGPVHAADELDLFFYFGAGAELEGGLVAGPLLLPGNPGTLVAS